MDDSFARSSQEDDFQPVPGYPVCLRRQMMLTAQRDWCMSRLSSLSLNDQVECCRALTAEHLELLKTVDQYATLWMVVEPGGSVG